MNAWGHFKTITSHKLLVMRYCFKIGLYRQGLLHDLSKYSWTEFRVGIRYYQGTRSPNNAEREAVGGSTSWMHHKGRNRHHFEYWVDYGIGTERILAGVPMPRKYIAEMIMDRISASRVYNPVTYDDRAPLEYYEKGKEKLWFVHEDTKMQMEYLLKMLAVKGEKETLRYIRKVYLKGKGRFGGEGSTYRSKPWVYLTKK
ncbi:MAG: catalase [Clostridiales bacterium]|nr:catalase [Clostridiales bacterium]